MPSSCMDLWEVIGSHNDSRCDQDIVLQNLDEPYRSQLERYGDLVNLMTKQRNQIEYMTQLLEDYRGQVGRECLYCDATWDAPNECAYCERIVDDRKENP